MKRILVLGLAVSFATVSLPAVSFADQTTGSLSGRASSEAKVPYTDYFVQLRDPATGQATMKTPVDAKGLFAFAAVPLSRRLVVELVNTKSNEIVCTEGPYILTPKKTTRSDININCGTNPAAWALLAGGIATSAAVMKASGGN